MKRFLVLLLILLCGQAWASRLGPNTTPAERKRGATWADKFESQVLVEENGGAVTGAPTFSINSGVVLDGAADYITYNLAGTEFDNPTISIVIKFNPDFAVTENAERFLFDTTNGEEYSVAKRNNAANNVLSITLGNTLIADVAEATYTAAWVVGSENTLTIYGTTGDTSAVLNSTAILTADATAWTADTPASLFIGAEQAGGSLFDGTVRSIKVFKAQLTLAEANDYQNNSIYTYRNNSTGLWDLTFASHDPTAVLSLDVSGNGNDATLGDGVTPATYPTKIGSHRGYTFDGVNDYFSNMPALPGAYTVVWMDGDGNVTFENAAVTWTNIITSGNHTGDLLFLALFPFVLTDLQELDLEILLHKELNDV